MIRKSQSFSELLPLVFAFLCLNTGSFAFGQVNVYENGQPTLVGSDASMHIDNQSRRKIDLAGNWAYSMDNENWKDVKVPSSFDYRGRITFVRKFTLDRGALATSAFHLIAFGINHDAEIYLNGVFVGRHVGGYTTVDIDLPENALQIGSENAIKIVVNNNLSARSTLPLRKQIWGWRDYDGILRDIYLLVTPKLWTDNLTVQTDLSEDLTQGTVNVVGVLNSKMYGNQGDTLSALIGAAPANFVVEVVDNTSGAVVGQSAPQQVSVKPNRDYEVKATVAVKAPRPWSPETPELYLVRAKILMQQGKQSRLIDEFDRLTGFRRFGFDQSGFSLNGKPLVLRGIVWHENAPRCGASLTYEQMEKDITLIKTLGANAVGFGFHPPHPYVLSLCDRYGLLAFVEIPAVGVPGEILDQETFKLLAESSIGEMVNRDLHRPSVVRGEWGMDSIRQIPARAPMSRALRRPCGNLIPGRFISAPWCFLVIVASEKQDIAGIDVAADVSSSLKSDLLGMEELSSRPTRRSSVLWQERRTGESQWLE